MPVIGNRGPPPFSMLAVERCPFPSLASGVGSASGENPHAVPLVRSADVGRAEHTPLRIEPHAGKVFENDVEPSRSEMRAVFDEDKFRRNLRDDSRELAPEPRLLAGESTAITSARDVLTRESTADDVDEPAPRLAVKSDNVIPDRKPREDAIALSGEQHAAAVGINLDSADGHVSEEQPAQDAATATGKKCELSSR